MSIHISNVCCDAKFCFKKYKSFRFNAFVKISKSGTCSTSFATNMSGTCSTWSKGGTYSTTENLLFQAFKPIKFINTALKTHKILSNYKSKLKLKKTRQKTTLGTISANCSKAWVEHIPPVNGNAKAKSKSLLLLLLISPLLLLFQIC